MQQDNAQMMAQGLILRIGVESLTAMINQGRSSRTGEHGSEQQDQNTKLQQRFHS